MEKKTVTTTNNTITEILIALFTLLSSGNSFSNKKIKKIPHQNFSIFPSEMISKHNSNFQILFFNLASNTTTFNQISLDSCPNAYLKS